MLLTVFASYNILCYISQYLEIILLLLAAIRLSSFQKCLDEVENLACLFSVNLSAILNEIGNSTA